MTPDSHGQARRLRRILDSLGDPVATPLLPDPVQPGRHARFEMFKVVPASPPLFAVIDGKLRA